MNSEDELLQRLVISKKIMEKHNDMGRGQARDVNMGGESYSSPVVEDYQAPAAKYNLPQEFMQDQQMSSRPVNSNVPLQDRIAGSKLPDEIKKLMMEHPIQQPNMGVASGTVLSDDLVERASRLMGSNPKGEQVAESSVRRQPTQQTQSVGVSADEIRSIIRETVKEVLHENGLLVESETKSSDVFKFRVGQHLFEGKVVKVKKIAK
jgi:hypothetical protein